VCVKHEAKFGTLADRGKPGTYTDPSDKHEISYGTWLAKNEITIDEVYSDLREQGFTLRVPEEYLAVNSKRVTAPKRRPGRPGVVKKTKVNEDGTESPIGTSMDGLEHKVVLGSDEESGISDDEDSTEILKKKVEKRKMSAEEKAAEKAAKDEAKASAKASAKAAKDEAKVTEKPKEKKKKEKSEEKKTETSPKEKKSEKPTKEKKSEKPTKEKKEKKSEKKTKSSSDLDEEAGEDEEVCIDGVEYILLGKKLFDENGTLRGAIVNGKAELIE
jgi:hypothetical protein